MGTVGAETKPSATPNTPTATAPSKPAHPAPASTAAAASWTIPAVAQQAPGAGGDVVPQDTLESPLYPTVYQPTAAGDADAALPCTEVRAASAWLGVPFLPPLHQHTSHTWLLYTRRALALTLQCCWFWRASLWTTRWS